VEDGELVSTMQINHFTNSAAAAAAASAPVGNGSTRLNPNDDGKGSIRLIRSL